MTEHHAANEKKIVFLESSFWKDGTLTNEMELIQTVSKIAGSDLTAAKRHPDVIPDRFTPAGIPVLPDNADLTGKLLISPFLFSDTLPQGACLISLDNMLRGDVSFLKSEAHRERMDAVARRYNIDSVRVRYPESEGELILLLDILKNRLVG